MIMQSIHNSPRTLWTPEVQTLTLPLPIIPWSLIFLLLALCQPILAQTKGDLDSQQWKAGEVLFDVEGWTEVLVGDMPLVISVPHGGYIKDGRIPDRDCSENGRVVKGTDSNTIATARAIQQVFWETYQKRPYFVISRLSRNKVDQNRDVDLGACGDPLATQAWNFYHEAIDKALSRAKGDSQWAIFIDLHGHGHKNPRLELGYGLNREQLTKAFKKRGLGELGGKSSLGNLISEKGTDFHQLLFGPNAFGSLMMDQGIAATPSLGDPHPLEGEKFFAGGYNTRRYTSADYPNVFGWQIECNKKGIRDSDANRMKFASALAESYFEYIKNLSL